MFEFTIWKLETTLYIFHSPVFRVKTSKMELLAKIDRGCLTGIWIRICSSAVSVTWDLLTIWNTFICLFIAAVGLLFEGNQTTNWNQECRENNFAIMFKRIFALNYFFDLKKSCIEFKSSHCSLLHVVWFMNLLQIQLCESATKIKALVTKF